MEIDVKQVLIAIDQVLNSLWWSKYDGKGYADETISARAWRLKDKHSLYKYINKLFFWQENHCEKSYLDEVARKQLPSHYRTK